MAARIGFALFLAVLFAAIWFSATKSLTVLLLNLSTVALVSFSPADAPRRDKLQSALISSVFIATLNSYVHLP